MVDDPRRLRESSTSDLERSLLDAGAGYRCPPGLKGRTLTALGVAGAASLTASSAGASAVSSSSLFGKVSWLKLGFSISMVGVGIAVPAIYYGWLQQPNEPVIVQRAGVVPTAPIVAPAAQGVPSAEAVQEVATVEEAQTAAPSTPAPQKASLRGDARGVSASAALTAELALLDAVRGSLSRGEASSALSQLDGYARTYPRGRLALEAEVLRIDSFAKSGRTAVARQRAENFLNRYPNSVLASRVRGYLHR